MKKILVLLFSLLIVCAIVFVGCSSSAPSQTNAPKPSASSPAPNPATSNPPAAKSSSTGGAKTIELSYNSPSPGSTQPGVYGPTEWFAKEVNSRTNGRVKIVLYYNNQLASSTEIYDAVLKGVADIGESNIGNIRGRFPISEAAILPYRFPSSYVNTHVNDDFVRKYAMKDWNEVVPILFTSPPPFVLGTTKKQVRTLNELKGLTIRVSAAPDGELLSKFGGVPRAVPSSDTYELLSKNVIDGAMSGAENMYARKWQDAINYITDIRCIAPGNVVFIVMSKSSWAKLSPEDQKTMNGIFAELVDIRSKAWDKAEQDSLQAILKMPGKEFIKLSPEEEAKFRDVANAQINEWAAGMKTKGNPADEWVSYVKERIAYWSAKQ